MNIFILILMFFADSSYAFENGQKTNCNQMPVESLAPGTRITLTVRSDLDLHSFQNQETISVAGWDRFEVKSDLNNGKYDELRGGFKPGSPLKKGYQISRPACITWPEFPFNGVDAKVIYNNPRAFDKNMTEINEVDFSYRLMFDWSIGEATITLNSEVVHKTRKVHRGTRYSGVLIGAEGGKIEVKMDDDLPFSKLSIDQISNSYVESGGKVYHPEKRQYHKIKGFGLKQYYQSLEMISLLFSGVFELSCESLSI